MTVVDNCPMSREWEAYSDHRTGGIAIKQLLERGGAGTSLEFNLTRFGGDEFHAPRHHHNFDQVRIGLEGETRYGPNGRLGVRTIGYFPEGVWYGPTTVSEPTVQAILQLDGPSRLGYIDYTYHDRATAELKERGVFTDGYYYPDDDSPRIDGYQAAWEQATGREMEYPEGRFSDPVYLSVDAFSWVAPPGSDVRVKQLAVFNERRTAISMALLPPGSSHQTSVAGRRIVGFVLSGSVRDDSTRFGTWSAFISEGDEEQVVRNESDEDAELILVTFPDFSDGPPPPPAPNQVPT